MIPPFSGEYLKEGISLKLIDFNMVLIEFKVNIGNDFVENCQNQCGERVGKKARSRPGKSNNKYNGSYLYVMVNVAVPSAFPGVTRFSVCT